MIDLEGMSDLELQQFSENITTEWSRRTAEINLNQAIDEAVSQYSIIMDIDPVVAEESVFVARKQKRENVD